MWRMDLKKSKIRSVAKKLNIFITVRGIKYTLFFNESCEMEKWLDAIGHSASWVRIARQQSPNIAYWVSANPSPSSPVSVSSELG